ncbi:exported protein of unknown function [Thermococcus nautili]|nr:exported protein of unknown function [Thermococcus nautili]
MNILRWFRVGVTLLLVVLVAGCVGTTTTTSSSQPSASSSSRPSPIETTSSWTPASWVAYDEDMVLNASWYLGDLEITHTSKVIMKLNIISGANSISYLAIIPASELEKWKENSPDITYEFITHHAKSGTYTATLSPGTYYVLVGHADPIHETLAQGTEVIKAGDYVGVPIDLSDILYAENVTATIDIREDLDIRMFFTTAKEYSIYREGGTPRVIAWYDSAKSGVYNITNAPPSYLKILDSDVYYFVLDNTNAWVMKKTVDYTITGDVVYPARIHLTIKVEEIG